MPKGKGYIVYTPKEYMTKVLAFGTFDLLHPGHEFYLEKAKKYGDTLIVVIARDETAEALNNRRPLHDEKTRLASIKDLPYVDEAFLGNPGDKYAIIEEIEPDVIVFGYDQKSFTDDIEKTLAERELHPKIIRLKESYEPKLYKSSKLRALALKK